MAHVPTLPPGWRPPVKQMLDGVAVLALNVNRLGCSLLEQEVSMTEST